MSVILVSVNYFQSADLAGVCLRNWARRDRALDGVPIDLLELRGLDVDTAAKRILEKKPVLVGFSCFLWNITDIRKMASLVKRAAPKTTIVLGGAEVGPVPERVLNANPDVDYVALSEGEETFRQLIHAAVLRDLPIEQVQGLARRTGGKVVKSQLAPLIDLDLAPPAYDGAAETGNSAVYETSRGCPFLCSFCDWGPRKMRYVPLERVEREFKALVARYELVLLTDADLLMDRRRGVAVMKLFREVAKGTQCRLKFDTNPIFLWPEVIDMLAEEPDRFYLSFGIQTTDVETSARIQRPFDLAKSEKNLLRLRREAPDAPTWFMTIAGLPGENLDAVRSSIDWVLRWKPRAFALSQLLMLPGAEITHEAHHPDVEYTEEPPYQVHRTDAMSRADMARARELTYFGEVLYQFQVNGRQAAVDILFGGAFDPLTAEPGSRIRRLEAWIEHIKGSGFDLTFGKPVADMDEIVQRRHIEGVLKRLERDKLEAAAFLSATRQFVESGAAARA